MNIPRPLRGSRIEHFSGRCAVFTISGPACGAIASNPARFIKLKNALWRAALCLWMSLCGVGCGALLKQPPLAKDYFAIDPGQPDRSDEARLPATVLRVRPLWIRPPFNGSAFAYRIGSSQFDVDYYDGYVASPASLLTGSLIDWLNQVPAVTAVGVDNTLETNLTIEGDVTALYIDSTAKPSRVATVSGRFFLIRERQGEDNLIFEMPFKETAKVADQSPAGFATALGQAWRQALLKLTTELRAHLRSKQISAGKVNRGSGAVIALRRVR